MVPQHALCWARDGALIIIPQKCTFSTDRVFNSNKCQQEKLTGAYQCYIQLIVFLAKILSECHMLNMAHDFT